MKSGGGDSKLKSISVPLICLFASVSCVHGARKSDAASSKLEAAKTGTFAEAGSAPEPESASSLAKVVLEASGVMQSFELSEPLLEEIVSSFPENKRQLALISMVEAHEKASLRESVLRELSKMSIEDLRLLKQWFLSDLGRAYLVSIEATRLASRSQYVIRHKDSEGDTPSKASLRFRFLANPAVRDFKRLEEVYLYWLVLHGGNAVRPAKEKISTDKIPKVAEVLYSKDERERRADAERLTEGQSRILSEAQWQGVIEFHESPLVRKFFQHVTQAISRAL